ncbi:toprim domain-containing protein [Nitrosomonas marina]|uniref:Putative DNA primase/helicase n=1 Tax=Nitrosomonas marina TaxID=917 RepID=A0A1H8I5S7_9PROT|nr:toprim domain-containing protein [Nitrosomonas marina]SEN63651.1 putative DNA primase/helicase [Nitrosomonas marina]
MPTNRNASGQAGASVSQNYLPQDYIIAQQFRQEMESYGIKFSGEIIPDGNIHRFYIEGHKRGTLNGAYTFHLDGCPAGWFMDHTRGISQTWRFRSGSKISAYDPIKIAEARQRREAERLQAHEKSAEKAAYINQFAVPAINHPYLTAKRIQSHGTLIYKDKLIVPIYNESDRLVNLQFIEADGTKRFLSGGRKRGCFYTIGDLTHTVLICEGFATGASLHEDTSQRVVIAFDAGNLLPVARNIRELSPDSEIIICADNDISGVGQAKATEAALSIGAKVLTPPTPGTDWNDVITGGVS